MFRESRINIWKISNLSCTMKIRRGNKLEKKNDSLGQDDQTEMTG